MLSSLQCDAVPFHSAFCCFAETILLTPSEAAPPFPDNGTPALLGSIWLIGSIMWIYLVPVCDHLHTVHLLFLPRTVPGTSQPVSKDLLIDRDKAVCRIISSFTTRLWLTGLCSSACLSLTSGWTWSLKILSSSNKGDFWVWLWLLRPKSHVRPTTAGFEGLLLLSCSRT